MGINIDSLVSSESKIEMLEGRIKQFAMEAYQYKLNLKTSEALGLEEQSESAKQQLTILEAAIKVHQEELNEISK
jgi:hypothetical protein